MDKNSIYRSIPKVDVLLREKAAEELIQEYGYPAAADAVREILREEREALREHPEAADPAGQRCRILRRTGQLLEKQFSPRIRRVWNGTGVILHTGLGRAPLGESARKAGSDAAGGYTSLEYDLETGKRGERSSHFERILCRVTGAEAAMAVNNNAAAVLLALTALAKGGEVLVSRGELVEIGGEFRIPDVMGQSGAVLREVGTTNRTRLGDYELAAGDQTRAVMKVHTSNYRIIGFTESVSVKALAGLCREKGIPLIADLGSGVLIDLKRYGLEGEPTVQELIRQGADVVCFSGDKLLGGPQAGILAGKAEYIARMRRHPLARALRIDKFTASALEAVMLEYLNPDKAIKTVPVLRMLTADPDEVKRAAEDAADILRKALASSAEAEITVEPCISAAGGGALPEAEIKSFAVAISPENISAGELAGRLRKLDIPVIGRISDNRVLLDMRTFEAEGADYLARVFRQGDIFREQNPCRAGGDFP